MIASRITSRTKIPRYDHFICNEIRNYHVETITKTKQPNLVIFIAVSFSNQVTNYYT